MDKINETRFSDRATTALSSLFSTAEDRRVGELRGRVARALEVLSTLDRTRSSEKMLWMLRNIDQIASQFSPVMAVDTRANDHDYNDFFRLARSVKYQWGPWTTLNDATAYSPTLWALYEILRHSDPKVPSSVLEIGAGTGGLAYEIGRYLPNSQLIVTDPSLESLVIASLIHSGEQLSFPVRVSPIVNQNGIGWYDVRVEPHEALPDFRVESVPRLADVNYVVAVNSLSLAPDPLSSAEQATKCLIPGGLFIWIDLLCWRVETPVQRRILTLSMMANHLKSLELEVVRTVTQIPYIEDWGFERSYHWTDHMLVMRKKV